MIQVIDSNAIKLKNIKIKLPSLIAIVNSN